MTRIGTVLDRVDERIPGSDLPLMSVSQTLGVVRRSELTDKPPRAESLDYYKVCRRGDIVFNKMSVRAGALGVAPEDGLVTYHYEVIRPSNTDPRFLVYLMKSDWFIGELVSRERGIGAGDSSANVRTTEVPFRVLRTIDAHIPTISDQNAIADYLDCETARIDTLIAKQEQLIATLRERWTSAVSSALASSEADIVPLRRIATVTDCAHVTADFVDDDTRYPVASIRECQGASVDLDNCNYTTRAFFDLLRASNRAPAAGDLLFVRNVSVGLVAEVTDDLPPFAIGQETVRLRPDSAVVPTYLRLALTSARAKHAIESAMVGSTFRRINVSAIRSLPIDLVTVGEQRRLVESLAKLVAEIDGLIAKTERFIALARERRAALITAAVTGQVDVTDAA